MTLSLFRALLLNKKQNVKDMAHAARAPYLFGLERKYCSQCADSDGAITTVVIGIEDKL